MSDRPIQQVLNLLRLLKNGPPAMQNSMLEHLKIWAGEADVSNAKVAQLCAYFLGIIGAAETEILDSGLTPETKEGLLQTIKALKTAFAFEQMGNAPQNHLPTIETSVTSFAIFAEMIGAKDAPRPSEADELLAEVEEIAASLAASNLDRAVTETAKRHLSILATLLRNVEIFGVDSALAAYAEMIVRLQRALAKAPPQTSSGANGFWARIRTLGDRLTALDRLMNSGQKVLEGASGIIDALPHITSGQ